MKRLGEIELIRFLTALVVVIYHSLFYSGCACVLPGGHIGVEFFFLLSGYLMAAHIQKKKQPISSSEELWAETYQYLRHRISSFWPELFFACCIGISVFSLGHDFSAVSTISMAHDTLMGNVLLLQMAALAPRGVNGPVWYLSALLLSSSILYPLFRRYGHSPIWPVTALLLLGYISTANSSAAFSFAGVREWMGWTYKGNLRALAELTIGASLYPFVQNMASMRISKALRRLLTIGKWACYAIAMLYCFHPGAKMAPITLLALGCVLVLCFSRLCCDYTWYQKEWILWLGRFSLPLYLSHIFWAENLENILPWLVHPWGKLLVYVSMSVLTALTVMFLAKQFRLFVVYLLSKRVTCSPTEP